MKTMSKERADKKRNKAIDAMVDLQDGGRDLSWVKKELERAALSGKVG